MTEDKELTEDEIKILRDIVEREKAVTRVWGWIRAFLYVAVPVTTLYSFYELLKNGKY